MQPTLLLGLDGATFSVLDMMMTAGHMPFLRQFQAEGVRAELLSTPHPLTPPAWTTVMTGRSPGNHGIYDFLRSEIRNNRAFFTLNNFRDIQCETLWTLLSRYGGRVLSLNFPLMAPAPPVAGVVVPGLLSWKHLRRNIYPPEIYDDLKSLPGFNARHFSYDFEEMNATPSLSTQELIDWVRSHVIEREQHWFQILRRLLADGPWDLAGIVLDGVDKLQHACWRFLDPDLRPTHFTDSERILDDLCVRYFRQLDGFLREAVVLAGPTANVIMVSDHGFGPTFKSFRVNKWLETQGYLKWPQESARHDGKPRNLHFVHLDWEHTTVYAPSTPTSGIHIRVRRQPGEPGVPPEEYQAFRARLIEQLRAVRDPETGRLFFTNILKREEAFPGRYEDRAPDLTLVPFDYGFVSVLNQEPVIQTRASVTGTHHPVGVLLARGPAIACRRGLSRQAILDVAPTLLHCLELPVPEDFEGKVMADLFDATYWETHPVRLGPATETPTHYAAARVDAETAAAEEQGVLNRLRALGYVE